MIDFELSNVTQAVKVKNTTRANHAEKSGFILLYIYIWMLTVKLHNLDYAFSINCYDIRSFLLINLSSKT